MFKPTVTKLLLISFVLPKMFLHAEKKIKLLSAHETIAVFEGLEFRTCRGRTARCPKNCGDSGEFAKFRIVEYLRYEKNGKYGDKEQQQRLLQVSDFFKKPKGDPNVQSVVKTLKNGDRVRLDWNHNYVIESGRSYPVRTTTKLQKATAD